MIKVEQGHIETSGQGLDMLADGCIAMTEVIRRVSNKNDAEAELLFYSSFATVAEMLGRMGVNIDLGRVARYIIEEGEDGPDNGSMD